MYHYHWGLSESPFRNGLDPRRFHKSVAHDEALARLHFLTDRRRRLGVLLAGPGCGKSLLLEVFAGELRRSGREVAVVGLAGISEHELLWQLSARLGLNPGSSTRACRLWQKLVDRVGENRRQGIDTVFLLDDADEASREVQSLVARLAVCDSSPDARLTIVLTADGNRLSRLGPRLLELAELRIDVAPWEFSDTVEFVLAALHGAGRDAPAFSDQALHKLHELAHGTPRRVIQLADLALLAGAGQDLSLVDAATVATVHGELAVGMPAEAVAAER